MRCDKFPTSWIVESFGNRMTGLDQNTDAIRPDISSDRRELALERVNKRGVRGIALWEWTKTILVAFGLFVLVRSFLVEAFKIPSGSMERTLLPGDFLLVNKLVYGAQIPFTGKSLPAIRKPRRGDVIVFQYPVDQTKNFVKRLMGVPGDTLSMRGGVLFLNGTPLEETYVSHSSPDFDPSEPDFDWQRNFLVRTAVASVTSYDPTRDNWGPIIVPPRNYFMLGDNRDNSSDSRYWGFVPDSLIRGRPMFVYYSFARDSVSSQRWLSGIRWDRLGERVK
jgi:signal peptidase I